MSSFYTNVQRYGSKILYRGIKNGQRIQQKVGYSPTLFLKSDQPTKFTTIHGQYVAPIKPGTMIECRKFLEKYQNIQNFEVYGYTRYEYAFISDLFPKDIQWNRSDILVANLDIEVGSENGFPEPETALEPITAITVKIGNSFKVFGCGDFTNTRSDVQYIKCQDEIDLIKRFLAVWTSNYPDIITGWHCIPTDQSVWQRDRIVPISRVGDVLVDSKVLNRSPITKKKKFVIKLANGHCISASGDHKIPTVLGNGEEYSKFSFGHKEKTKTKLLTVSEMQKEDSLVKFLEVPIHDNLSSDNDLYSDGQIYLAGLIYTDGSIRNKSNAGDGYKIYQSDYSLMETLTSDGVGTSIIESRPGQYSRSIKRSLLGDAHSLIYDDSCSKKLNVELISLLSKRQFLIFLSGLLDGDGCCMEGVPSICNYNNDIPAMYELCLWNGILSTISGNILRLVDYPEDLLDTLRKRSRWNKIRYGFLKRASSQKIKDIKWKKLKDKYLIRVMDIVETEELVDMMDIETDTGLFISSGVRVHNCKFFDIPYLVNRITRLLGESVAKTLSPWGMLSERSVFQHNKKLQAYIILGISTLDYLELYKKFAPRGQQQESYKLDYICSVEINAKKLSYDEYGSLHKLYKENYQKFIDYNIKDVELVDRLDEKLKLIDLALTLSYDNKCNYEDVFAQVRMWDVIIFNHLRAKKLVVPQIKEQRKDAYVGAYVKDPQIGIFNWVASYDVSSLYPHLIMQFNISPETLIQPENYTSVHKNILSQSIGIDQMLSQSVDTTGLDCSLTPNGQLFSNEKQGILPELMEKMFKERDMYKKKMKDAKRAKEAETDPAKIEELEKTISMYDNLQLGKKVSLNSAYGSLGNNFFRFYDPRQASAITTAGQLTIRWIEKHLNKYLNGVLKTKDVDYVIYADTDSNYLNLDALVSKTLGDKIDQDTKSTIRFMDKVCEKHIQPAIDKAFVDLAEYTNAYAQKLSMKREALCSKGLWTGKKRYILNVYDNEGIEYAKPEVKITGMEMIKSTTPQVIREKLKKAVDIILNEDEIAIHKFISNFKEEFKKMNPADIASASGVNGVSEYTDKKTGTFTKGTPMHVRGCIIYNNAIKSKGLDKKYPLIGDGEKIKFIALKEPNFYNSDTIAFQQDIPKELDLTDYIDYDAQYDKVFIEPLRRILTAIGWKTEETNSLEDWFT